MKQHHLIGLIILLATVGCQTQTPPAYQAVPMNGFVKQWEADFDLHREKDEIVALHVRENALIVYTKNNNGYWLSASGGEFLSANQIVAPQHLLHPPLILGDRIAIPTGISIETYTKTGKHLDSFISSDAIQSNGAVIGNSIFIGISHPGSGRLARYDVASNLDVVWQLFMPVGIVSGPAVFTDAVYAASVDGRVWALTLGRDPLWNFLPDNTFSTYSTITADLAADESGVYVPAQDKKLYCLERATGKIKWAYFAGMPLLEKPIILGGTVYQFVPERGLAAISKTEGQIARDAMWVQPSVKQILAADEKYLYVRAGRGEIVALDKTTGQPQFRSTRDDLDVFATNLETPIIYAATKNGTVLAIHPVLKPGTVGEVVMLEEILPSGRVN